MKRDFISKTIALSLGVLAMSLLISFVVLASTWTGPTDDPPYDNVSAWMASGYDAVFKSFNTEIDKTFHLIGTYNWWDSEAIYIAGYNYYHREDGDEDGSNSFAKKIYFGLLPDGPDEGTEPDTVMTLDLEGDGHLDLGAGKITVGIIDPVFEIEGEKYATYMSDFAGGTRIETSNTIKVKDKYVIDFEDLEKGSDLWLFWQTSNKNIKDVTVLLTSGFSGDVWYEKDGNSIVIYVDKSGEVSYGLSAPRVDSEKWPNFLEDQSIKGIEIK